MALRRRFLPVFKKHAPRGMARFAKSLQGPFGPAAKHSQKHKNRPEIGRFSHFNPSAEMYPFSPFSTSKAPEKWLCTAVCRKKQLFAGSFVSRSHSFCSFTAASIDGANSFQSFLRITVPMLSPTTFLVVLLSTVNLLKEYALVQGITQGGPGLSTTYIIQYIFDKGFNQMEYGYASAISTVVMIVFALIAYAQFKVNNGGET